jgi:cholesterol transport system auxiliary component
MTARAAIAAWIACILTASLLILLGGCAALRPIPEAPPAFFSLDQATNAGPPAGVQAPDAGATLVVNPPNGSAGFDSQHIIFLRQPHRLEYFAQSEWIDTPARMLGPLIVAAIERQGAFRAVVLAPRSVTGDLELDTEILRLQHEFLEHPSRVHFTLRATLVDTNSQRVLAVDEFDIFTIAPTEDPYGGVLAASQAVTDVLKELASFCAKWGVASSSTHVR